jgi:hypothetical protein
MLTVTLAMAIIFMLESVQKPEDSQPAIQSRDCQSDAPRFVITNSDVNTGRDAEKDAKIREFIWNHWHKREAGCLKEKRFSKEGIAATTTFSFASTKDGSVLFLVARQWSDQANIHQSPDPIKYTVSSIERHGSNKSGETIKFSKDAMVSGTIYRLVFYDAKGAETGGL